MTALAGDDLLPLLGSSAVATAAANLLNNLPAFLIIGPDAVGAQLDAVLVGVNAGPMLTPTPRGKRIPTTLLSSRESCQALWRSPGISFG